MNKHDIESKILEIKRELFQLRFKRATRQSVKPHLFKRTKNRLVHLLIIQKKIP